MRATRGRITIIIGTHVAVIAILIDVRTSTIIGLITGVDGALIAIVASAGANFAARRVRDDHAIAIDVGLQCDRHRVGRQYV